MRYGYFYQKSIAVIDYKLYNNELLTKINRITKFISYLHEINIEGN